MSHHRSLIVQHSTSSTDSIEAITENEHFMHYLRLRGPEIEHHQAVDAKG